MNFVRTCWHLVLLSIACAASTVGIAGEIYLFPPDSGEVTRSGVALEDPAHSVVLLYTAGSDSNRVATCRYGASVPPILRQLAGVRIGDGRIVVVGYCAEAVGDLSAGISMAESRAPELEGVGEMLLRQGVAFHHLFVAGHSMGGWTAVLVELRHRLPTAGVIAFAPANGVYKRALRKPEHWSALSRELQALRSASDLRGLIYGFPGDDQAERADLLAFSTFRSAEYREWTAPLGCPPVSPHMSVLLQPCFASSESEHVLAFIRTRLDDK